jgi:hypothetical protein
MLIERAWSSVGSAGGDPSPVYIEIPTTSVGTAAPFARRALASSSVFCAFN